MPASVSQIPFKKFTWCNALANGEEEIRWLRDNFSFESGHLADCTTPPLRPKIEFSSDYIFIVLLFPLYNRKTGQINPREIDVFLGKNFMVTVHTNEVAALRDLAQKIENTPEIRTQYQNSSPIQLFLGLAEGLLDALFPMLNHVSWDIDTLDNELFSGHERELIHKILYTKKNIVDIRKSMQGYRNVLTELEKHYRDYFGAQKLENVFNGLITKSRDIWDQIENHKNTIDTLAETNGSLITFRLNDIMQTLTALSLIVFPLTLVATLFSMNATNGMPFVESPYGFWKILIIMSLATSLMFYYFKKHRWL